MDDDQRVVRREVRRQRLEPLEALTEAGAVARSRIERQRGRALGPGRLAQALELGEQAGARLPDEQRQQCRQGQAA